ncbi:hypothetical protein C0585_01405 [Candidatus Woesearchaeota archaeon]|nr:MAG: hypothetical protein C0585_01405 [Candidatus Woesearchaeota archaeon]
MNIIVDTNVLLSALIKDSITRKIIMNSNWKFYYPEISFHEIRKYKELVKKKAKLNEEEYTKLISTLLKNIRLVSKEQIIEHLEEAKKIFLEIDPDDVAFIATSLSIKDSIIWTNDKGYEKQDKIIFIKTEKILKIFEIID